MGVQPFNRQWLFGALWEHVTVGRWNSCPPPRLELKHGREKITSSPAVAYWRNQEVRPIPCLARRGLLCVGMPLEQLHQQEVGPEGGTGLRPVICFYWDAEEAGQG